MICTHQFVKSQDHPGYEVCENCLSYHSTAALPPAAIYGTEYWSAPRSTIRDQVHNVAVHQEHGLTKNEFVLRSIAVEDRSAVLEIGCAPGRLLLQLRGISQFERVVGVEVNRAYEADIREIGCHGGELLWGLFPEVTWAEEPGSYSCVIALDVLEHCEDGAAFLAECARLLKSGGQVILMLPLVAPDLDARFWEAGEHCWIYSQKQILELMWQAGFKGVRFTRWCAGHDVISGRKI